MGCKDCRWNKFESQESWSGKEGRGKGCNESRMLVGMVAFKREDGHYQFDEGENAAYIRVGSTSIKSINAMIDACASNKVLSRYTVFNIGVLKNKKGPQIWGTLTQEFVGYNVMVQQTDRLHAQLRDLIISEGFEPEETEISEF